jgi:hypothetical protein
MIHVLLKNEQQFAINNEQLAIVEESVTEPNECGVGGVRC